MGKIRCRKRRGMLYWIQRFYFRGMCMTRQKKKNTSKITLALACLVSMIGFAVLLYSGALYIEAKMNEEESRSRVELFDPRVTTDLERSYKTMWIQALSDAFAADFKDEYFYHIVYDHNYEISIVRMTVEQFAGMKAQNDYMYGDFDAKEPDSVQVQGTAVLLGDDIKEYALEVLDYMFGAGVITSENFEEYVGSCYLDLSRSPNGGADFEEIGSLAFGALFFAVIGLACLIDGLRKMIKENEAVNDHEEMAARQCQDEPEVKGNWILGIVGALFGAMAGAVLWVIIGLLGFIAGLAGFMIMNWALKGYKKFSGKLDRAGVIICIVIGVVTIPAAGLLECFVELCMAYMKFDLSFSTIKYVAGNFLELMSEGNLWELYAKNLLFGYLLSHTSSRGIIQTALEKSKKTN